MPDRLRNDQWRRLFSAFRVLETIRTDETAIITAAQINSMAGGIQGYAARNMCKVDSRPELPDVMAENGLALLAVSNGAYCISHFDPFVEIPAPRTTSYVEKPAPEGFISLASGTGAGESKYLDTAMYAGMLQDVFGEEVFLTLRGRRRGTGSHFAFELDGRPFDVRGVQIEVDGGYEGQHSLHLVEAKIGNPGSVSIRQVLYPVLYWRGIAAEAARSLHGSRQKPVLSYVLLYDEPLYRVVPIDCDGTLARADVSRERIFTLSDPRQLSLLEIPVDPRGRLFDHDTPFPQADDFNKVLTMLSLIGSCRMQTKADLFDQLGVVSRQVDYYLNTLLWMKLCTIVRTPDSGRVIELTQKGTRVCKMSRIGRLQEMANIIFSEPVSHAAFHGTDVERSYANLPMYWQRLSGETRHRRAGTMQSWIRYFREVADEQARRTMGGL